MLHRLPSHLPPLSVLLDDLCQPSPAQLAAAMGVHPRTAARWVSTDRAPRPVLLSLFWLTRWGQSAAACDAVNAPRLPTGS